MAGYIDDLDDSYPDGSVHKVFVLDDDIRDIKSKLKATFPGVTTLVTASDTELNYLVGASSNLQAQLDIQTSALATLTARGVPYSGKVSETGSGTSLPATWSSSRTSAGNYLVNHGLTTTQHNMPVLTLDAETNANYFKLLAVVSLIESTRFGVLVIETNTGTLTDCGFYFHLHSV